MRTFHWRAMLGLALLALAATLAACGGSSGTKKGGTLTVINASDFEHIDPGAAYYQFDYMVDYATQRPLYSYKPEQTSQPPTPDLAAGPWKISNGGKTATIKIRKGVKFSPPVNREVTSADVKYAIEREFTANVANGYVTTYLSDLQGAPAKQGKFKPISGIRTPDKYTIVFKFKKPTALVGVESFALIGSSPVPEEYAKKYDKASPSTYGQHQVATGPYMIQNDAKGNLTGYTPNRRIVLVRNPNWDRATDFRPAYLDKIVVDEGNPTIAGTRKVWRGSHMVTGDITPPGATLKQGSTTYKDQFDLPWSGGFRYVSFNTTKPPFDNANLRKAVIADTDRSALRQARGGPILGPVATHWLPPQFPGFQEAGGEKGFGIDFMSSPTANHTVAMKYWKAAGFPTGKYTGKSKKITMVADDDSPGKDVALVMTAQLRKMGFQPETKYVPHPQMISICGIPKKEPNICPNNGWFKDFFDPQTLLDATFNGKAILPENNNNYPQLNDPKINAAIAKAREVSDLGARNRAWAAIDKMITAQGVAIPYLWDKQPNARSKDVNGVVSQFQDLYDLSFTSLKK